MTKNSSYIIRPGTNYSPSSDVFLKMREADIFNFYQWFMEVKPYCIEELIHLVTSTSEFENWDANDTPESLAQLGLWFFNRVEKNDFSEKEIATLKKKLTKSADFLTWDLTDETKSLALYVGMYYGEVAIKSEKDTRWEYFISDKQYADYGQPVIVGKQKITINPVRVAHSLAYRYLSGNANGDALQKAYNFWANLRT